MWPSSGNRALKASTQGGLPVKTVTIQISFTDDCFYFVSHFSSVSFDWYHTNLFPYGVLTSHEKNNSQIKTQIFPNFLWCSLLKGYIHINLMKNFASAFIYVNLLIKDFFYIKDHALRQPFLFKRVEYKCKCLHTCSHTIFIGLGFTKDFNTPL